MAFPAAEIVTLGAGEAAFHYSEKPGSQPVILLHGGGLDRASLSWRYLFPLLAKTNTVLAPNWPGYGGSAAFDRHYTIADLGRWLCELMDALQIARADMVGISMGGGTALWMAVNAPERVRRLVPVGSYGVQSHAPYHLLSYALLQLPINAVSYALMRRSRWMTRQALKAIFADTERLDDGLVDEVMQVLHDSDVAGSFSGFQRAEIAPNGLKTVFTDQAHSITHPTLFIHGRYDSLVPLAAVETMARKMPEAEVEILEAGHWPMRECPEEFNPLVRGFLQKD